MFVICKTNEAFEDQLTANGVYQVVEFSNGSVLIDNDNDDERWYGMGRFYLTTVVVTLRTEGRHAEIYELNA